MKRMGLFLALAIVLTISGTTLAQNVGDKSYYWVTYYSNNVSGAPDATVRIVNDGAYGGLAATFYVFDDSQELQECGNCPISVDGLLSEDVKTELTHNPLTGRIPSRGVIKIFEPDAAPGLHGWATHIERATATSGAYTVTEAPLADSNLSENEETLLGNLCYYAQLLGSGQGVITCTPEDYDF
jgi:hypothetical protein